MSDSVIEDFLGGEPAEISSSSADALGPSADADALASALAVESAEAGSGSRADAIAYLQSQKALVDLQVRHFDAQRRLLREERLLVIDAARRKRFADRLKNTVQLLVTLAAALAAVAVVILLRDAVLSRAVVVDPFRTPPALAPRGIDGQVVAAGLLDELQTLQTATRSTAKGMEARNAWFSDIRIEVPQTGMSVGEIDRLLRQRLGHDLHISGDLIQTETGGLQLTVRGDGVPAQSFAGQAGDLARLTRQAAEYVYGRSQPVQFAVYLTSNDRDADALAFIPGAYRRADSDAARARLANVWGNAEAGTSNLIAAAAKYRLAMSLQRHNWLAWSNLIGVLQPAFGEEAAWRESRAFLAAVARAPADQRPELRALANPAANVWDLPLEAQAALEDSKHNSGAGANAISDGPALADVYGLMHDPASAARYMAQSDPADPVTRAEGQLLAAYDAVDRQTPAAAVASMDAFYKTWLATPNLQAAYQDAPCVAGLVYAFAGRAADAEAAFKRTGQWSRCYALHGDAVEHQGDLAAAERIWAEGLAVAPDLPLVYLHRGLSELRRADLVRAATDLAAAHARAPHFADPLKAWGDLLARQGRWREALARYDEALKYAPAWPALRQAREAAASRSG